MNFPKFADGRTEKKVTPKDPLRICERIMEILFREILSQGFQLLAAAQQHPV